MATSLEKLLQSLGLSAKEAKVYLSALQAGEATVQDIAHASQLPRTTVASILGRLKELGFVTVHKSKGKLRYWIEDPHILVEHERARLDIVEQLADRLHTEYHSADKKPQTEVFDTKEGIKNLIVRVVGELKKGDQMLAFESPSAKHYQAVISDELFHALSEKKSTRGVFTRVLIPEGQAADIRAKALEHNVTIRTLPKGVRFESSMWIFHDSIVLFSGTHTFATRITHRHMAESLRSLFEFFWGIGSSLENRK